MTRAVEETCSATDTPVCTGVVLDGVATTCTSAGECEYTERVIEVAEACVATAKDACPTADLSGDHMFGLTDMGDQDEACAAVARDVCAGADISSDNTCTGGTGDNGDRCDLDPSTDGI